MQIIIDISEEVLNSIKTFKGKFICENGYDLIQGIKNGTPLPPKHGDLIDRNDLLADSYCIDDWSGNEVNIVDVMTIKNADTIIEADAPKRRKGTPLEENDSGYNCEDWIP